MSSTVRMWSGLSRITKGTVDEKVMKALQNKDAGQEMLLEAVKAIIGGTDL